MASNAHVKGGIVGSLAGIARRGKPAIVLSDQPHAGESGDDRGRIVGGAVIDDDDLVGRTGLGQRARDRLAQIVGMIEGRDDDRDRSRLDAGLQYALETLQEDGHTAYREADLIDYAAELLETDSRFLEARIAALEQSKSDLADRMNHCGDNYVQLQSLAEQIDTTNEELERALERWFELAEILQQA